MTLGKKLEHTAVLTAALIFAGLLYQDWRRVQRSSGATNLSSEPVQAGRRYHGKINNSSRSTELEMQFTAFYPPRVTVEMRSRHDKTGRFWSGVYNATTHSLSLQDSSAEQLTLNYNGQGSWLGNLRIPRSNAKGARRHAPDLIFPVRFDAN